MSEEKFVDKVAKHIRNDLPDTEVCNGSGRHHYNANKMTKWIHALWMLIDEERLKSD